MTFFLSLIIASIIGTIVWIVQRSIRPFTQKVFSQTWHYYSGLISVFFLLGGSVIMIRLIRHISSLSPHQENNPKLGKFIEPYSGPLPYGLTPRYPFHTTSWFDHLIKSLNNHNEFFQFALLIWAAGTLIFIALNIKMYWTFKRSILRESHTCHSTQCSVKVIVSTHATTPMLIGFWKPVIVLPNTPMLDKEIAMILSHELIHYKRGDLYVKLLLFGANAIHWFNPAAYAINKQVTMLCELSCDEKVVQKMDMENRKFYGETLLSMLAFGITQRNMICTNHLCNTKKDIQRRLMNLMNEKKTKKSMIALSLVVAITLVGSGGAAAYAAGSATEPSKSSTSKEIAGANVSVMYQDGTIVSFDKNGTQVEPKLKDNSKENSLTVKEIVVRINKYIEKGLIVPQPYIDALPQKDLDTINKTQGLKLKKSK